MKKYTIIMMAFLMLFGFSTAAVGAPMLEFDIDFGQDGLYDTGSTYIMSPGDIVLADIYVSGLNEVGNGLSGWGLALEYGDNLSALSITANRTEFPLFLTPNTLTPDVMVEGFTLPGALGVEGDNIFLFTLELECTDFGLDDLVLWDMDKGGVSDNVITSGGDVLDGQFAGGLTLASINNVPIPGAVWLLGSGLLGLVGIRRRMIKS